MAYDPTGPAPQPPDPRAINGTPYATQAAQERAMYQQAAEANRAGQVKTQGDMRIRTTSRPTPPIIRAPKRGK